MIEIINPKDESEWLSLRCMDVTSTEISALFGISPYSTPFELWHRKKSQQYVKLDPNERMRWGVRLQDAIAAGIAEEKGFSVRRMTEYIRNPELRIGASFDFSIIDVNQGASIPPDSLDEKGLLEIKNVDSLVFKNDWTVKEDGTIEGPLHIEIQCQHQLLVSGRPFLWLGVLIGGNQLQTIYRTPDQRVHDAIKEKVASFWNTIDNDIEPKPDFEADASFIKALYNFAEPGTVLDIYEDGYIKNLADEYNNLGQTIKLNETRREAIKAEILTRIGTAEKAVGDGFSITAGMVGPAQISYTREGYRGFRINWKKVKENS